MLNQEGRHMLRWIVESSQRLKLLVVVLSIGIIAAGFWQLPRAPKEVLPEFAPVYVEVQTEALGLSAEEVENLVTIPIEHLLLNGVAWLDDIHSESVSGLSSVVLFFEPGTDPLRARQMVAERLTRTGLLPRVSKPPQMLQPLSSSSRVMMVRVSSNELSTIDLSVLARWDIQPALMGVPGVANVLIWGQRDQQLQVLIDPARLNASGVTVQQVINTTGNSLWVSPLTYLRASSPGSGGFIDTPQQRLGVQHLSPITSPESLAMVPIEGCDPTTVAKCPTLGDVATIVEGHQPLIGDAISADGQGLLLVIEKFPGADTADVTAGIQSTLSQMQPGLTAVVVDPTVFNRTSLISSFVDNTVEALIIGFILALLLLTLFLVDWRSALVCAFTMPLALVAAALVLDLRGTTFDIVVLAGLVVAIGVIIDDVVVTVDAIARHVREQRAADDTRPVSALVTEAVLTVRSPLLPATIAIVVAALPILFLGGLFDSFFLNGRSSAFTHPIVISYVLAIVASLAVALVITPTLAALLLRVGSSAPRTSPVSQWIQGLYGRALGWTLPQVGVAAAATIILLAIGAAMIPQLREPESIVPASRDRDLLITWEAIPGTSLPEMQRITGLVATELRAVPGVANVGAHVGRALASDQIVNVHSGELWVNVDPGADYDRTLAAVTDVVTGYPGINHRVQTYLEDRVQVVEATDRDVVLRIYGTSPTDLLASGDQVLGVLSKINGVSDARIETGATAPEFHVEVDLAKAQEYGLTPGDVRRIAATLVRGLEVGSLFEDQKVFDVVVQGVPELRQSQTTIENIQINTPAGKLVRMGDIATVSLVPVPVVIEHDSVSRYVDVTANVVGRPISSVTSDVKQQLESVAFPVETHAEILGTSSDEQTAWRELIYTFLAAIVGIFLIAQAAFGSWRLAILSAITLPTAMVGGLVTAFLFERDATLGVLLGLMAVFAITVRQSFVLVSRANHLREHEQVPLGPELVQRIAQERLAPILMTTMATALALAPFAVRGAGPGLEILRPMAIVALGGLVTSALVTLFIVPSLYLRFSPSASARGVADAPPFAVPLPSTAAD
jgi:Cu/Ag efflux pump CusA